MKLKSMKIAALVGLSLLGVAAQADTYAFMIGINDYPDVVDNQGKPIMDEKTGRPINADLRGCVNDITEMKQILMEKYNVPEANIRTALDKQAGEDGFINGWKWLLSEVQPGDTVFFYYSGHGGQIKTDDPKEEDGLDEVIVLADNKLVPDDFFGSLSQQLAAGGLHATFVFDSCFSGGIYRDALSYKGGKPTPRFIDDKVLAKMKGAKEIAADNLSKAKATMKGAKQEGGSYAFILAGQENQTTADISGMKDIPDHGLFSLLFSATLMDHPDVPMQQAIDDLVSVITDLKFEQRPTAEFSSEERANGPLLIQH